jgi:hypothetical protein|tara:strand:- start:577 stop:792 length:216 start_codon:yes stop_codon:yes gene_type:complete
MNNEEKTRKFKLNNEMLFLQHYNEMMREIDNMYKMELKNNLTMLNKEDWLASSFLSMYLAVSAFRKQEENV